MSGRRHSWQDRRRAGRSARRLVQGAWRGELGRQRRVIALLTTVLAAVMLAMIALAMWLGSGPFVIGMLVGAAATGVPLVWLQLKVATGIAVRELGAEAERWTATELHRLDPARWQVVHDLPLRSGNLDHLAIGPGRIYAIETKWTSARGQFRDRSAQQAARQAAELARELRARGVAREVIPVVVIWGPGVAETLQHRPELDPVSRSRIVAGALARDWLDRMDRAADAQHIDQPAIDAVRDLLVRGPRAPG